MALSPGFVRIELLREADSPTRVPDGVSLPGPGRLRRAGARSTEHTASSRRSTRSSSRQRWSRRDRGVRVTRRAMKVQRLSHDWRGTARGGVHGDLRSPDAARGHSRAARRSTRSRPTSTTAEIALRLPAVVGTYDTWVRLVDAEPPTFGELEGRMVGRPGTIAGRAAFHLGEVDDGTRRRIRWLGRSSAARSRAWTRASWRASPGRSSTRAWRGWPSAFRGSPPRSRAR